MAYFVVQKGGGSNDEGPGGLFVKDSAASGTPGTDPSDPPVNVRQFVWLPYDTTLKAVTMRLTAAPGALKTANFRVHKDSNGNISPVLQIVGASSTEVSADVEEDIEALDVTSDTTIRDTIHYLTVWPSTSGNAAGASYRAFEYLSILHPELCFFVCNIGGDTQTATFSGADAFATIVGGSIDSSFTTQSSRQIPMAAKGRIKVAWAAWRGYTSTTTVEAVIQKGTLGAGIDTAALITMIGAGTTTPYQASIITSDIAVAEGDFLNWRITRTAGAATGGAIQLGFGYAAGL
jgi:hypothetical protein